MNKEKEYGYTVNYKNIEIFFVLGNDSIDPIV